MKKSELTAAEKRKLVMGMNSWSNDDLDGKIYRFRMADGPIGLRTPIDPDDESKGIRPSTVYPSAQTLSHTWEPECAEKMGEAIANDCIEAGVDIILGPAVNIKRLPTCGRNFEYYSEDPILAGRLAAAYINGVQKCHVGTSMKHFCCNNTEYARLFCSSEVDERTLREIYLKPFEIAAKAKPWTTMCSYNLVNGTLMSENKELFRVLREEFGFDGLIESDWTAVRRTANSVNAGLDLEMPHHESRAAQFEEDYAAGIVDETMLDTAAGRVLDLAEKCEAESKLRKITMTEEERKALALRIAEDGIVLLKNDDGLLPLHGEKIMITGAPERKLFYGGGSARVTPDGDYVRLSRALADLGCDVCYRESTREPVGGQICMNGSAISCREELKNRDVAIIEVGDDSSCETEGRDRQTIRLTKEEESVIHYLSAFCDKVIVVVYAGSAVDMSPWIDEVSAVVWAGFGGQRGNEALANVLTGRTNPSGKLTETFPLRFEDIPAANAYIDPETVCYEEGLMVGYRYFETRKKPVLFPFGYGLSYSSFIYSDLKTETDGKTVTASFTITNTSDVDGKEIAQLYVSGFSPEKDRPRRELKGFTKVTVPAHESVRTSISFTVDDLKTFSVKKGSWMPCKDAFAVEIGPNCHEIALKAKIKK